MPQVKPYATPWESAQALVADHALTKYGIIDADPMKVVTDMAFAPSEVVVADDGTVQYTGPSPELRLAAAKTLLRYTRPEVRAVIMRMDGNVNVEHTLAAETATSKARALLSVLGTRKYLSGSVEEGETAPALLETPTDPVQH